MKLISWNVNGLRSAEKHFLQFINEESPDILMLQELRAHPDQLQFFLKFISGYKVEFNPSRKPGYSGTALYYKDEIPFDKVTSRTGNETLDSEGRTIVCKLGDLIIINFYTPNGTSSEERLKFKLKYYDAITDYLRGLLKKKCSAIVGGDINVAPTELDLYSPEKNKNHSGFLPVERDWFSELLQIGFIDTFRMFEKGGGHYTWWHMRDPRRVKNRGWRFDYFLVSKDLKKKVVKAKILRDVFGSDHCPIGLEVEI